MLEICLCVIVLTHKLKMAWEARNTVTDEASWKQFMMSEVDCEEFCFADDEQVDGKIAITSPLIYRDLLLALEKSEGYFFGFSTSHSPIIKHLFQWFYLNTGEQPRVASLIDGPQTRGFVDVFGVGEAVENILLSDEIFVEEGAAALVEVLKKIGKEVVVLSGGEGCCQDLQVPKELPQPSFPTPKVLSEGSAYQGGKPENEMYTEVTFLRTKRGYVVIVVCNRDCDHLFEKIVLPSADKTHQVASWLYSIA